MVDSNLDEFRTTADSMAVPICDAGMPFSATWPITALRDTTPLMYLFFATCINDEIHCHDE